MDYLLRDAYFTGVNYGTFDLERILRVIRPYKGHIVVKESGMHAIEDYLMSRYQMYWQVYFHPVTRSAEILLHKIFARAKHLYEEGYTFGFMVEPILHLIQNQISLEDYLLLDESVMQTMLTSGVKRRMICLGICASVSWIVNCTSTARSMEIRSNSFSA